MENNDHVFDGWLGHEVGEFPPAEQEEYDGEMAWLDTAKVRVALGRLNGNGQAEAGNIYAIWLVLEDGRKIGLSKEAGTRHEAFYPKEEGGE